MEKGISPNTKIPGFTNVSRCKIATTVWKYQNYKAISYQGLVAAFKVNPIKKFEVNVIN